MVSFPLQTLNPAQIGWKVCKLQQGTRESCGVDLRVNSYSLSSVSSLCLESSEPESVPLFWVLFTDPSKHSLCQEEFIVKAPYSAANSLYTHTASHCNAEVFSRWEKMWVRYMEQTWKEGKIISDRLIWCYRLHVHDMRDPKESCSQCLALSIRIRHNMYITSKLYLLGLIHLQITWDGKATQTALGENVCLKWDFLASPLFSTSHHPYQSQRPELGRHHSQNYSQTRF